MLQEVTATEYDNHELGIADYYHHFPKKDDIPVVDDDKPDTDETDGKKVWL